MQIKGFLETTLTDYEGKVAAMIFLPGCNLRCSFCFNSDLVLSPEKLETIPFSYIEERLEKNRKLVDAVVISGGEPTLHTDLPELLQTIKGLGFFTKIDTNGTNPKMLGELIEKKLVDFVSMDVKTCLDKQKYEEVAGLKVDLEKIRQSIKLLLSCGVDYEFRTTVLPKLHPKKDILEMARQLSRAKRLSLQRFRPTESMIDKSLEKEKPYSVEELEEIGKACCSYLPTKVKA